MCCTAAMYHVLHWVLLYIECISSRVDEASDFKVLNIRFVASRLPGRTTSGDRHHGPPTPGHVDAFVPTMSFMANDATATETLPVDSKGARPFVFPDYHNFPPFYTLQPNLATLSRQLALWSALIRSHCAHNKVFRLNLQDAVSPKQQSAIPQQTTLFHNSRIGRTLDLLSARRVIDWMSSQDGDRRAEWASTSRGGTTSRDSAWIHWRRPEEWADAIHAWVDSTGQRGSVLTVYELREGDDAERMEWAGMEEELFRRCIDVLVRRGKAQVFGAEDGAGIKFF